MLAAWTIHLLSFARTEATLTDHILAGFNSVLPLLALSLAVTTPGGPDLHYSRPIITGHAQKVASDDNVTTSNVSLLTSASPLSCLFFSWATSVVRIGASKTQLDAADLPFLVNAVRPSTLYRVVKRAVYGHEDEINPGAAGNKLFWRLLHVNRKLFLAQFVLAMITACLYYLPACAFAFPWIRSFF